MIENDRSVPEEGRPRRNMTKGEQTRQKIVAAAAPIFNQHGYEGSSMAELMAATGLQKGGIYRHFASKEELAAEAFDYTWKTAWEARMKNVDQDASGIDRLKQLIGNFVEGRSSVGGGCPVLNTAVDATTAIRRFASGSPRRSGPGRNIAGYGSRGGPDRRNAAGSGSEDGGYRRDRRARRRPDDEPPGAQLRFATPGAGAPEPVYRQRSSGWAIRRSGPKIVITQY